VAEVFGFAIFAAWAFVAWLILGFEREPEEKTGLAVVALASAAIGGIFFFGASPISDYFLRFILGLLVAIAVGIDAANRSRRFSPGRAAAAAIVGAVLVPGGVILLLAVSLSVSGESIG
jgi:hypothetical protein